MFTLLDGSMLPTANKGKLYNNTAIHGGGAIKITQFNTATIGVNTC